MRVSEVLGMCVCVCPCEHTARILYTRKHLNLPHEYNALLEETRYNFVHSRHSLEHNCIVLPEN